MINESLPDCIKRMEFEKAIRSLKIITSELNHITAKANAIKNRKNVLLKNK
jgi:ethanolamine utilization microcompartment shell protein EutL